MAPLLIDIPKRQAFIYASFLVLYEFLTYIANDMIMPGMLKVVESFHGPESAVANSLIAYVMGGASLQLFLGPISDRYGRRPVMIFGAIFFFLCTVLIGFSNSIDQFLLARFFQGMGLCFIGVIGYATLQEIFGEMDAIRLIAIMANIAVTAPLVGPMLGAAFIYYSSWRMIFVVIGALSLVALWGLWRFMPEPVGQTKTDGEQIKPVSLSPRRVAANYKQLLMNRTFMFGAISLGAIYLPCMAWIALSPIMLVSASKLTLMEYGLWQLPVFSSYILGTLYLHHKTHTSTVKQLIAKGTTIVGLSLPLMYLLPLWGGGSFLYVMPGLIIYFFGVGMIAAPISRFTLFCTPVSKGTASALMSMISMCIQSLGILIANILYSTHNNLHFAFFCAGSVVFYFVVLGLCFLKAQVVEGSEVSAV